MSKKRSGFRVGSNLVKFGKNKKKATRRAAKKIARAREKAAYKAKYVPKVWWRRYLRRLNPRTFGQWMKTKFGRRHFFLTLGGILLAFILAIGALFAVFATELSKISPDTLAAQVASTVNRYYDRNGNLLWEDKGTGNYRLVVDGNDISKYMKEATVAIEDKDFYKHGGVSFSGIMRAAWNNFFGGGGEVQGGSTLTQQLIKQVYFADEANDRGISGIPRKIKEVVLSIEAEGMYSKDQILNLYLNESPYGGRRNGVESAAQTYFGKSAKDLDLAESAMIASIPQNPTLYNPYYVIQTCGTQEVAVDANDASKGTKTENITDQCSLTSNGLIRREQTTLDYMADQGYITKAEAEKAKKVNILSEVKPQSTEMSDAKAPHFVEMVKQDLIDKLGATRVGQGGLTITTTLDLKVQTIMENSMTELFNSYIPAATGFDNASATMVDVRTGQVLGMQGSRDYNYPGYGAVNEATSFIQPGSSIKPFVYASLFNLQGDQTFGAGSILPDTPIPQSIYRTDDGTSVQDADGKFLGNIPIRKSLAWSRNVPAIRALSILGVDNGLKSIRAMGDVSYCTDGTDANVGLAAAIGGCGVKQVEHANTFATLANGGVYHPVADILEVKDSAGKELYKWKDEGTQTVDPQSAYIVSDILHDEKTRAGYFGYHVQGMYIPGVQTGTKTGTTDLGGVSKDIWMNSFSTQAALSVWYGNHVPAVLKNGNSEIPGKYVAEVMTETHEQVFSNPANDKNGDYHWGGASDWLTQPEGIQKLSVNGSTDIYPSWYNKNQKTSSTVTMTFDSISKKVATDCTPAAAKVDKTVTKLYDPLTKKYTYEKTADGFDPNANDDVHSCSDSKPQVSVPAIDTVAGASVVKFTVLPGNHTVTSVTITINGSPYDASTFKVGNQYQFPLSSLNVSGSISVSISAKDELFYEGTNGGTLTIPAASGTAG
jgi:penicillin-binding protein 1A